VQGTWRNNLRKGSDYRVAQDLIISSNQFGTFEARNSEYAHILFRDRNERNLDSRVVFSSTGHRMPSPQRFWDNNAKRHIIVIPLKISQVPSNPNIEELHYLSYAFTEEPNDNKIMWVEMRLTKTTRTKPGAKGTVIRPLATPLELFNAGVLLDKVAFSGLNGAKTRPDPPVQTTPQAPQPAREVPTGTFSNNTIEGVAINLPPNFNASGLAELLVNFDPNRTNYRFVIKEIENLTVDNDPCNGSTNNLWRDKAEYLGQLDAWIAFSSSCVQTSSSPSVGRFFNFPAARQSASPNPLILTKNQKHSINMSRDLSITANQFNNARLVFSGWLSEVNICSAHELGYTARNILTTGNCRSVMLKDLKPGDGFIEIGNNTDKIRIHYSIIQP
jgi:hypothetical protein